LGGKLAFPATVQPPDVFVSFSKKPKPFVGFCFTKDKGFAFAQSETFRGSSARSWKGFGF